LEVQYAGCFGLGFFLLEIKFYTDFAQCCSFCRRIRSTPLRPSSTSLMAHDPRFRFPSFMKCSRARKLSHWYACIGLNVLFTPEAATFSRGRCIGSHSLSPTSTPQCLRICLPSRSLSFCFHSPSPSVLSSLCFCPFPPFPLSQRSSPLFRTSPLPLRSRLPLLSRSSRLFLPPLSSTCRATRLHHFSSFRLGSRPLSGAFHLNTSIDMDRSIRHFHFRLLA
jgi:hypothetical protein